MKLPPQITRLVLLTLGIVSSYLVARYFLTPSSFGEYGWYRGAALEELASRTPVFAGKKACEDCHADQSRKLAQGPHQTLSCEACHGVSGLHAENPFIPAGQEKEQPDNTENARVRRTGNYCLRCHEANPSRPDWFKQITLKDHYSGKCADCHDPHQPNEVP
jgi:hypothetical protein